MIGAVSSYECELGTLVWIELRKFPCASLTSQFHHPTPTNKEGRFR